MELLLSVTNTLNAFLVLVLFILVPILHLQLSPTLFEELYLFSPAEKLLILEHSQVITLLNPFFGG